MMLIRDKRLEADEKVEITSYPAHASKIHLKNPHFLLTVGGGHLALCVYADTQQYYQPSNVSYNLLDSTFDDQRTSQSTCYPDVIYQQVAPDNYQNLVFN